MLQFPSLSLSVSVQQSSSEGPIRHKFFFSANLLSNYGILMVMKSQWVVIFPRMLLDDFLQKSPPQVSHFVHLLSSAFLALDHRLW
jgi:hypothetical protein